MTLEDWKALREHHYVEIGRLKDLMDLETSKLRVAQHAIIRILYGIDIGSIVTDDQGKGDEYRVTSIKPAYGEKPWIEATPKNKNGEWSKLVRHLYNHWELIK